MRKGILTVISAAIALEKQLSGTDESDTWPTISVAGGTRGRTVGGEGGDFWWFTTILPGSEY